jgi:DNA-directed RNA polymerase specialized sigma24 family protein
MAALPALPPSPSRPWTEEEKHALSRYLQSLAHQHAASEALVADLLRELVPRLIAPSGIRRYRNWRDHQKAPGDSGYCAWLERIVEGYIRYRPLLYNSLETANGTVPILVSQIETMVNRYCHQINFVPDAERRRDFVGEILLSLVQSYFYDTELEDWLWKTTRNHVRLAIRRWRRFRESSLDEHLELADADHLAALATREDILAGIRRIKNRRYRVILLLMLLYRLDNIQLAAFFGVPVDVVYTWCANARQALRRSML